MSENHVIALEGDHLSLVGHDITTFPLEAAKQFGSQAKTLDLSYNSIEKLDNLALFSNLTSLVVDNNKLVSEQSFPVMDKLKTLSITDLKLFLDILSDKLPQLTYLSMIKNPACPNEITGKDSDDYQRYRLYVLYRLKNLRFLDSSPVSGDEKKEAQRVGTFPCLHAQILHNIANLHPLPHLKKLSTNYPQTSSKKELGKLPLVFSSYVYYGRQSEGNRFIVNEDL